MARIGSAFYAAAAMVVLLAGTSASEAGPRAGYITATSDYGNGTVSAPVRMARFGYQVKIPGGAWLYCKQSGFFSRGHPCADTLRRQHLDFWEAQLDDHGGRK